MGELWCFCVELEFHEVILYAALGGVQRPALWRLLSHSVQWPGVSGSDGDQLCSRCSALLWFVIHCQGRLRIPRHCHVTCRGMPLSFPVLWECGCVRVWLAAMESVMWTCAVLRGMDVLLSCHARLVTVATFCNQSHFIVSFQQRLFFFSLLLSLSLSVSTPLSVLWLFFPPSSTITDDGFLSKKQQAVACLQAVTHYLKIAVHSNFSKGTELTEHYAGALK